MTTGSVHSADLHAGDHRTIQVAVLIAGFAILYASGLVSGVLPPTQAALFGFAVPVVGMIALVPVMGLFAGRAWAATAMLVTIMLVLSLSFRTRDIGSVGLDWQNGVKLACWAMLCIVGVVRWRDVLPVLSSPVPALLATLGLMAVLSVAWSQTPAYTFASAMGFMAYLFLAAIIARDLSVDQTISVLLWSLFAFIVLSAIGGVITPDISWMPPSVEETEYRLQGYAGHPNSLGQMTGIFLIFTLIAHQRRQISRAAFVLLFLIGIGVMLEAGSRTILGAVFIAWLIVSLRRSHLALPLLALFLTLLTGALLIFGLGLVSDIEWLFSGVSRTGSSHEIMTLTGRTDIWAVALEKIAQKPFFGWGYNGTEALISGRFGKSFYGNPVNAHNAYLQLLLSLGILGALPGFLAMGAGIWLFFTRPDGVRDMIVMLYLFNGMAEADGFATPGPLLLLFFWAFAQSGWRLAKQSPRTRGYKLRFHAPSRRAITGRETPQ